MVSELRFGRLGHELRTVTFSKYIDRKGKEKPGGSVEICRRCGCPRGSKRFEDGCVGFSLPRETFRQPEPKYPRAPERKVGSSRVNGEMDGDMFHYALDVLFNEGEAFGGLSSRMGSDLDMVAVSHSAEPALPQFMQTKNWRKLQMICAAWRALRSLDGGTQERLARYYGGRGGDEDEIRSAHKSFASVYSGDLLKKRAPTKPSGKKWTTKELAERVGVSERRIRQMATDAGAADYESTEESRGERMVIFEETVLRMVNENA